MGFNNRIVFTLFLLICENASAQLKSQDLFWGSQRQPHQFNVRLSATIEIGPKKPPEKFYDYSISYNCRSRHDTGEKPNKFNQKNNCVGITKHFDWKFLGLQPYITYLHVFENSREGKMVIKGPGVEACWLEGPYFDTCPGLTYARVDYEDGWKGRKTHGNVPIPHVAFKRGEHSVVFEMLGKDAIGIYLRTSFN